MAFILDLGISVPLSFGLFKSFAKKENIINTKKTTFFGGCDADVFDVFFCSLFSLFLGACCT